MKQSEKPEVPAYTKGDPEYDPKLDTFQPVEMRRRRRAMRQSAQNMMKRQKRLTFRQRTTLNEELLTERATVLAETAAGHGAAGRNVRRAIIHGWRNEFAAQIPDQFKKPIPRGKGRRAKRAAQTRVQHAWVTDKVDELCREGGFDVNGDILR